ncbi:hypothetical protein PILCRDRAFT_665697 [Piloderma croceum F 1598]|uniref:DUF6533 domain-containing protein n=1 Tax=Piloderma croceum (strain F 1598) TaxID=765440 RepID=A0A0C3API8_PILCF|nr:hypothetical protein PILCRDRAFT_665697 [Piloderma croceum F 1598]
MPASYDQVASETITSNYIIVASVTFLLYDYALTFAQEVEFVWQQKMGLGKALFLLNRYIPMIDLVFRMIANVEPAINSHKLLPVSSSRHLAYTAQSYRRRFTAFTSYLGYLEAGKEYFNFAWLALWALCYSCSGGERVRVNHSNQ